MFVWREREGRIVVGYTTCSCSRRRMSVSVGTVEETVVNRKGGDMKALGAPVVTPFRASRGGEGGRFTGRGGDELFAEPPMEEYGTAGQVLFDGPADLDSLLRNLIRNNDSRYQRRHLPFQGITVTDARLGWRWQL
jgi:hypothetical protein